MNLSQQSASVTKVRGASRVVGSVILLRTASCTTPLMTVQRTIKTANQRKRIAPIPNIGILEWHFEIQAAQASLLQLSSGSCSFQRNRSQSLRFQALQSTSADVGICHALMGKLGPLFITPSSHAATGAKRTFECFTTTPRRLEIENGMWMQARYFPLCFP